MSDNYKKIKKPLYENSFATHEKAQFWSDKNELKPCDVFLKSGIKFFFDCNECGHELYTSPHKINSGRWCCYCTNQQLCKNGCDFCYKKSFATHEKVQFWSYKNELMPCDVIKGSEKLYWFDCDTCHHEFDIALCNVTKGKWCRYCANQVLCDDNDCDTCFNKSFASSKRADYWSDKNELKLRDVFLNANKKYWFKCNECNHEFDASPNSITNLDSWCPYCDKQKLCDDKSCKRCFNRSFASHEKSKYWSNKNELTAREVFKNSHFKYFFDCGECKHSFEMILSDIAGNNSWCPNCVYKTEKLLYDKLLPFYSSIKRRYVVDWCKNKKFLPFDFIIPEHNIIIELDGPHHFVQISNWANPEKTRITDKYKMKCANENDHYVIRIIQVDVWKNKYDWLKELNNNIKLVIKKPQNIYMCKNKEYDVYK